MGEIIAYLLHEDGSIITICDVDEARGMRLLLIVWVKEPTAEEQAIVEEALVKTEDTESATACVVVNTVRSVLTCMGAETLSAGSLLFKAPDMFDELEEYEDERRDTVLSLRSICTELRSLNVMSLRDVVMDSVNRDTGFAAGLSDVLYNLMHEKLRYAYKYDHITRMRNLSIGDVLQYSTVPCTASDDYQLAFRREFMDFILYLVVKDPAGWFTEEKNENDG